MLKDILTSNYCEVGKIGIWTYFKYGDGRLECISDLQTIALNPTPFGTVFSHDYEFPYTTFSYPFAFVGNPFVDIMITANQAWVGRIATYDYRLIGARFMTAAASNIDLSIYIRSVGRWK